MATVQLDQQPAVVEICNNELRCVDNIKRPCLRKKYHTGPCNPFSDAGPEEIAKPAKPADNYLNKLVVAYTTQGQVHFVGRCVSYTDRPTLQVRLPDGTQVSWVADLCKPVELPLEAVEKLLNWNK